MIELVIAIITIFLFCCLYSAMQIFTPKNLPPGPRPYPLVGNTPSLLSSMSRIHLELANIAEQYGNILTLYLNGQRTIVVSSFQIAREALVTRKDEFAGRPSTFSGDFALRGSKDIAFNDFCPTLVLQRKVIHTALRIYRPKLGANVCGETNKFVTRVQDLNGEPFDPHYSLSLLVLNVICEFVFGVNYKHDDPYFVHLVTLNNKIAHCFGSVNVLDVCPFLIHFPIKASKLLKESKRDRDVFLTAEFDRHMETYNEDNIRDVTDALIKALSDAEREDSKSRKLITVDHVLMTLGDMFSAGHETTVTTLKWLFAYLVHFPDIQEKIHSELDRVIGQDPSKMPVLEDRGRMPYLEASILETLRIVAPVPLGVPHKATCDTMLAGYNVPKDTTVIFNVWAIHHKETDWDSPGTFNPERFLDKDGQLDPLVVRKTLSFGAGRRSCIGEADAKINTFLIAARFLHRFRLEKPRNLPLPNLVGHVGIALFPHPYKICAKERL